MSITGTMSAAISGMQAGSVRVNVAAGNIANVNTGGYRPLQVRASTLATKQVSETGYSPGGVLVAVSPSPGNDAGVDLAQEAVNLIMAEISYNASAQIIRRAEDMARLVVDLKA